MPAKVPAAKKAVSKKKENPLFAAQPKNLRVGNAVQVTRDVSRFVRWPRNVRVQRQKRVLYERLKVPPTINQFSKPLDRAEALPVFSLLAKYRPETKAEKKARLEKQAAAGGAVSKPPATLKYGLNHITYLIEQGKAKFVVIASDVDPVELVLWLPALCKKKNVPYAIVNNKGRLGALVHQKTATALALTANNAEDNAALDKIIETANAKFANNVDSRRKWGGGLMGLKTQRKLEKRQAMLAAEAAKKAML